MDLAIQVSQLNLYEYYNKFQQLVKKSSLNYWAYNTQLFLTPLSQAVTHIMKSSNSYTIDTKPNIHQPPFSL